MAGQQEVIMPKYSQMEVKDGFLWVPQDYYPINSDRFGSIYLLLSPSGKIYIGQTKQKPAEKRWENYRKLNCKDQPKLYNALKKYGPENFVFKVIEVCKNQQELDDSEKFYIKDYDSIKNGYNIKLGGNTQNMTPEIGRKISETKKEQLKSGIRIHNWTGKHHSDKTKRILSIQRIGIKTQPHTEEWKRNLSKRLTGPGNHFYGVPFFLGKKHSEETKLKMSLGISRTWELTNPLGKIIVIKNLKKFCKENGLNNSLLVAVSKGRRKTHKGWKAKKLQQ